jgi:WD40 repeat protein
LLRKASVSRDAWIAAGTNNGDIRVWQVGDWTPLRTYVGHTDWVRAVAFSPDNRTLISGSDDQTLRLWDIASGRCRLTIPAHTGRVLAIALSPDGATLASGGEDRLIRLWDARAQPMQVIRGA